MTDWEREEKLIRFLNENFKEQIRLTHSIEDPAALKSDAERFLLRYLQRIAALEDENKSLRKKLEESSEKAYAITLEHDTGVQFNIAVYTTDDLEYKNYFAKQGAVKRCGWTSIAIGKSTKIIIPATVKSRKNKEQ